MAWHPRASGYPRVCRDDAPLSQPAARRQIDPAAALRPRPRQAQWPSTQTQPPVDCCAHRPGTQVVWPGGGGTYWPACQAQVLPLKRQCPGCQTTGPMPGDGGGTSSDCGGGGGPGATSEAVGNCSTGGCTMIWVVACGGS